jgi:hypothetical protein
MYQPPDAPASAPQPMRYAKAGERPPSRFAPGHQPDVVGKLGAFMRANPQLQSAKQKERSKWMPVNS